jgi:ATP-dependent DNA ligase
LGIVLAVFCAFDLLKYDGWDLRRRPIEERKAILAKLLSQPNEGIAFNQHYDCAGAVLFKHACALGCEGIVSKQRGSSYRSGRVYHWLKVKNPAAPAVRREAEEGLGPLAALTMREVVIVAIAGALIGMVVVALLVHFLP